MVRFGLTLALVGLLAACGGREPPPEVHLRATAVPEREITEYGEFVPVRFTVVNQSKVPVLLERVDNLVGRRQEMFRFREDREIPVHREGRTLRLDPSTGTRESFTASPALLLPGVSISFTATIRALLLKLDLAFMADPFRMGELENVAWLPDPATPGRWHLASPAGLTDFRPCDAPVLFAADAHIPEMQYARIIARMKVPAPPFSPPVNLRGTWTYSLALKGFVLEASRQEEQLYTRSGMTPLPGVPFDFLDDLDRSKAGVDVMGEDGNVTRVTRDSALSFLTGLLDRGRQLDYSDAPNGAPYRVTD